MRSTTDNFRRSTCILIAKCLIVLIVLATVCGLSIWAWFTSTTESHANGISVVAKCEGVQVSWDGENFYNDLSAASAEEVIRDEVGLAKNLCDSNGVPSCLKLVTGNGLKFFEPTVNQSTGEVLKSGDSWQGKVISKNDISDNSNGKFIDFDLYFRGTLQSDIYLTGNSCVSPKNVSERISDYGAFSKDNIASASRIAFLNSQKNVCSFIWAPNDDGHLIVPDCYNRIDSSIDLNNAICTLVNPDYSVAVSSKDNYFKTIGFKNGTAKASVSSKGISSEELFTVEKIGAGNAATYKFINQKTNKYLAISAGSIKLDDIGASFTIDYDAGFDGPILKCDGYVLAFKDAKVTLVSESQLTSASPFTVYSGSGYAFESDSQSQVYQYYDYENGLVELNDSSEPKLFTSTATTAATEKIGNTKIATLTKANETDQYYTAHIVVRVWVEGTDREAKLPLADGIFNLSLCFTSISEGLS